MYEKNSFFLICMYTFFVQLLHHWRGLTRITGRRDICAKVEIFPFERASIIADFGWPNSAGRNNLQYQPVVTLPKKMTINAVGDINKTDKTTE